MDRFLGQAVAGIIAVAPQAGLDEALAGLAISVPLVAVGCGGTGRMPAVRIDNVAGAALATRHLLDLGHRTVHHIAGPGNWHDARDRITGWRQTLRAAGAPEPQMPRGDWSARSGYEAGRQLAARPDVTAVFCANDPMALGFLRAAAEAGRRVPRDISVVGFDDVPEAAYFSPPASSTTIPCCCAATPTASARSRRSRPAEVSASHQTLMVGGDAGARWRRCGRCSARSARTCTTWGPAARGMSRRC